MITVCGVVVATIAMVCTLSVFNGFKGLTNTLFSVLDPDLKITPVTGKVFDPTTAEMMRVCELPEVLLCCEVLQENALVRYGDRQEISVLKGVGSTFQSLVPIDKALIDGQFILSEDEFYYGVLGIGLSHSLGVNAAFARPVEINMPRRDKQINMAFPAASLQRGYAYIGGVYHINQAVYDEGFMFVSLELMRSMLEYEKEVSALELKIAPDVKISSVKKQIINIIGDGFMVKDRYEQQEASFKIVQIEKWLSYLMLCFILVLALFNVLASIAILMIEKEDDVNKLRSMGADNRLIKRIFLFEGWMMSFLGAVIGVVIGLFLCFLQQYFGFIKLGETAGTFVVDAYPVLVEWTDVLLTFVTVITIGFITVLFPVNYLGKKWLNRGVATCLLLPFMLVGCSGNSSKQKENVSSGGINLWEMAVTIEPLRFFTEKIAEDKYKFFSVVPVGQSPETYDPSPREMMRIGKTNAYFHIGQFGVEQLLIRSVGENKSGPLLVDLSEGMEFHGSGHIHEDDEHNHSHCSHGHDPHIWTSFAGARVMSENIFKVFSLLGNAGPDYYKSNYQKLVGELDELEKYLHEQLDTLSCRGFVVYHPALTYFAEEFGLVQYSIEEDGKEPSPSSLKKLIEEAKAAQVKVVFVQMEFDRRHAEQIAGEIGARVVEINPLDYQWDEQMKKIAKALVTNGEAD